MVNWLLALALVSLLVLATVGCGGDDDEGSSEMSSEEIVSKVEQAVSQPGMIFYAEGDDGSEVWLDAENERYRRKEPQRSGGLTSIGEGWTRYRFDQFQNEVIEEDLSPATQPRIDNPMVAWYEPLTALGYGTELEVIGLTQADGREVVAVNAISPVLNDENEPTSFLEGRVEVDAATYLPTAFERREVLPNGATVTPEAGEEEPAPPRVRYRTTLVSASEVPEGFFDRAVVEDEVRTLSESVAEMKALGLPPYWLGDRLQGPGGLLALPEIDPLIVDPGKPAGEFHYSLIVPTSQSSSEPLTDTVIIRMAKDVSEFTPPVVEAYAGDVPEQRQSVTVRGGEGVLFSSLLTPSDLPCPEGNCPVAAVPIFTRLIFEIGETAFQIETSARVGASGEDLNGYNTVDGIIGLADALVEANPPPDPAAE